MLFPMYSRFMHVYIVLARYSVFDLDVTSWSDVLTKLTLKLWEQVSAKQVQELRKLSGAGMMDCKRALAASEGDTQKASDYLRKKGLASADKKAGRIASEGAIVSYIHGGR